MSVTTAPTPVIAGPSWTHATRVAVLAVAFRVEAGKVGQAQRLGSAST